MEPFDEIDLRSYELDMDVGRDCQEPPNRVLTDGETVSFIEQLRQQQAQRRAARDAQAEQPKPVLLAEKLEAWVRTLTVLQIMRGFLAYDVGRGIGCSAGVARHVMRSEGWYNPCFYQLGQLRWFVPWCPTWRYDLDKRNGGRRPETPPDWWPGVPAGMTWGLRPIPVTQDQSYAEQARPLIAEDRARLRLRLRHELEAQIHGKISPSPVG